MLAGVAVIASPAVPEADQFGRPTTERKKEAATDAAQPQIRSIGARKR
jgi:hypothetical protein